MTPAKICAFLYYALLGTTGIAQSAPPPALKWSFKTAGPVIGSPVIDSSVLFVGSLDSNMYALDVASGKVIWRKKTSGQIRSAVCLAGASVVFVSGDGFVYALSKISGKEVWKFKTNGEREYELYSYADYFYSVPVVQGNVVYVGSGDSNLYALNKITGKKLWSFKTGNVIHSRPLVDSTSVYAGSFDGYFYALESTTGNLRWKFKSIGHRFFPKGEFQGNPAADNMRIYVGARDYNLYALDKKNGHAHWNQKFELGWAMGVSVLHDSVLYVGTSDDKLMLAYDPVSGRRLWSSNLGFNIFGGPALKDSILYIGTLMGKLFALHKYTGKVMWTWNTKNYHDNREKYFKEDDTYRDDITSVILNGSDFITMYHSLGAIFSTPVVHGGNLYVTSTDGNVYSFSLY